MESMPKEAKTHRGGAIVATTTTPSRQEADHIARTLVERKLAACVQIVDPIRSCYWWDGAVQEEAEVLLIIKTLEALVPAIGAALQELHPYEVPELVALPVAAGSPAYLDWLKASVEAKGQ
jgi:periplasmic divalent cation tolerance protein